MSERKWTRGPWRTQPGDHAPRGPVEHDVIQGTDQWIAARCGLLTASEIGRILTPSLKAVSNDKERAHVYEIAAQRLTQFVEPTYQSDDMVRGQWDEGEARQLYRETYGAVREVGFITNDRWGFTLGYSPDGLVGDHGLIECKSARQKHHVRAVVEMVAEGTMPDEHVIQVQAGLLIAERQWCDFISYCGGMPMVTVRVYPDPKVQAAILAAAGAFEERVRRVVARYRAAVEQARAIPTKRIPAALGDAP